MTKEITLDIHIFGGEKPGRIILEEITEEDRKDKKYLGTAVGTDIIHGVYLGAKYYEGDFFEEAKYYYINLETDGELEELRKEQPCSIKVEFYGRKLKGVENDETRRV